MEKLFKVIYKLNQFGLGKRSDVIVGAEPEDGQDELDEPAHHSKNDESESVVKELYTHIFIPWYSYKMVA